MTSVAMILDTARAGDLARIVVIDTWLDVLDRQKPGMGEWNLLLDTRTGNPRLVVIDYGLGLQEVAGQIPILGPLSGMNLRVPAPWIPYLAKDDLRRAIEDVVAMPLADIDDLVKVVPTEWTIGASKWSTVVGYLDMRRGQLRTTFSAGGLL